MTGMATVHEEVHQRAGEQQQVRKRTQRVAEMLLQDREAADQGEADKGNPGWASPSPMTHPILRQGIRRPPPAPLRSYMPRMRMSRR